MPNTLVMFFNSMNSMIACFEQEGKKLIKKLLKAFPDYIKNINTLILNIKMLYNLDGYLMQT